MRKRPHANRTRRSAFARFKAVLRRFVRRRLHGRIQASVDAIAARVGVDGSYEAGGAHDAFTHAYVSARLALFLGAGLAERIGDLNESFGSLAEGRPLDAAMDQHNNAVGRKIGKRLRRTGALARRWTAEHVRDALADGTLTVIGTDSHGNACLVPSACEGSADDVAPGASSNP